MEATNNNSNNINEYIQNICKKYKGVTRPIRKEDYTLTDKERKLLKGVDCLCCEEGIQELIGRPFTSCKVCFCCAGDNFAMDRRDLCVFVNDELTCSVCFWDETSPVKYYGNN